METLRAIASTSSREVSAKDVIEGNVDVANGRMEPRTGRKRGGEPANSDAQEAGGEPIKSDAQEAGAEAAKNDAREASSVGGAEGGALPGVVLEVLRDAICGLCSELLLDAGVLPCSHSFCRMCWTDHVNAKDTT